MAVGKGVAEPSLSVGGAVLRWPTPAPAARRGGGSAGAGIVPDRRRGGERGPPERLPRELDIADRVLFAGAMRPEQTLGGFDVFALSSDTEQMPNALLEATAAGRAIAAVDVGDVRDMVCVENRNFVVARDDEAAFAAALAQLLGDAEERLALGRGNRARAAVEFSQQRMIAGYQALFTTARSG